MFCRKIISTTLASAVPEIAWNYSELILETFGEIGRSGEANLIGYLGYRHVGGFEKGLALEQTCALRSNSTGDEPVRALSLR